MIKVYIKVSKQDIIDEIVPSTIGTFSELARLNLSPLDFFSDRAVVHEIGDHYYIFSRFFDLENTCRNSYPSELEEEMIRAFIEQYNLTTLTMQEFSTLQPVEGV